MGAGDRDQGHRWQQGQGRHHRGLSDGKPFCRSRLSLGVARLLARSRNLTMYIQNATHTRLRFTTTLGEEPEVEVAPLAEMGERLVG